MLRYVPCRMVLVGLALVTLTGCPVTALTGSVELINAAPGVLVTELYVVPTGSLDQGPNKLPQPLSYGQSYTLTGLLPGYYDEMAVAIIENQNQFVDLPNYRILIKPGHPFIHTVYFTNVSPAGPTKSAPPAQ